MPAPPHRGQVCASRNAPLEPPFGPFRGTQGSSSCRSGFCPASFADGAQVVARHGDPLLRATTGFLEAHGNGDLKIATAGRRGPRRSLLLLFPAAGAEQVDAKVPEQVFEKAATEAVVSEPLEDGVEICPLVQVLIRIRLDRSPSALADRTGRASADPKEPHTPRKSP